MSSGLQAAKPALDTARTTPQAVCFDSAPPPVIDDVSGVPRCFGASVWVEGRPMVVLPQAQTDTANRTVIIDFAYHALRTNIA